MTMVMINMMITILTIHHIFSISLSFLCDFSCFSISNFCSCCSRAMCFYFSNFSVIFSFRFLLFLYLHFATFFTLFCSCCCAMCFYYFYFTVIFSFRFLLKSSFLQLFSPPPSSATAAPCVSIMQLSFLFSFSSFNI